MYTIIMTTRMNSSSDKVNVKIRTKLTNEQPNKESGKL